jgi:hypothetical protein
MEITTELLAPWPTGCRSAKAWTSQIRRDGWWNVISSWGNEGWDISIWPMVAIAHFDGENAFGLAEYLEGDTTVIAFDDRAERDAHTDSLVLRHLHQSGRLRGPHRPEHEATTSQP